MLVAAERPPQYQPAGRGRKFGHEVQDYAQAGLAVAFGVRSVVVRALPKGHQVQVVVMGCGRVGAALADALARIGHDVAVIDRDSSAFSRLSPEFTGERVLGMG